MDNDFLEALNKCSINLCTSLANKCQLSDAVKIVAQYTPEQWALCQDTTIDTPVLTALKYERWDLVNRLIKDGYYYAGVVGTNLRTIPDLIQKIDDQKVKASLQKTLTERCNNDFLNAI